MGTDNEEAYRGSTVGSLMGSVNISSGKNLTINGSDVIAKEDIKLQGESVAITAQDAKTTYDENYTYKKSGLTVALTGTAADLYEAGKAVKESKKRGNDKLTALQAVKATLTGAGALDSQTQNDKRGVTGLNWADEMVTGRN
ncbi:hypothetical protein PT276_06620 [Orbaceae bacterium ESL0721]|nr:hypothetical protein [Orbaceae bacterium ESL0721]